MRSGDRLGTASQGKSLARPACGRREGEPEGSGGMLGRWGTVTTCPRQAGPVRTWSSSTEPGSGAEWRGRFWTERGAGDVGGGAGPERAFGQGPLRAGRVDSRPLLTGQSRTLWCSSALFKSGKQKWTLSCFCLKKVLENCVPFHGFRER